MSAYYNEFDPYAAQWLRNLIAAGHIAPGDVDERSIEDVTPDDLRGYTQCHFFAGIGVWSLALRRAGISDDTEVWTGSCPCQPFSAAGKGLGTADERHLWPAFHWLIEQRRPRLVFGEQVASKDGLGWLDLVSADLEGSGYAVGALDICAAGFGAPHIRQRLYWVADADDQGSQGRLQRGDGAGERAVGASSVGGGLADADKLGHPGLQREGDSHLGCGQDDQRSFAGPQLSFPTMRPRPTDGFWRDADWLFCRDGKWRPVEPGTFPLAHGAPGRVGRLRAYGNAIVAPQAEAFVRAYCEARGLDESVF